MTLQIPVNRIVVLTHVLCIPPITPDNAVGERSMLALEGGVATAHDGLAQVLKAVGEVALHLLWDVDARGEAVVNSHDAIETVW